jgi:CheY-like chemotaxis protein
VALNYKTHRQRAALVEYGTADPTTQTRLPASGPSGEVGRKVSGVQLASTPRSSAPPLPKRARGEGPSVLLISQNPETLTTFLRLLKTFNADVIAAGTLAEAAQEIASIGGADVFGARLVLLDMTVPEFGHGALMDELRGSQCAPEARLVLLCALSETSARGLATRIGADGFLLSSRGMLSAQAAVSDWLRVRDIRSV